MDKKIKTTILICLFFLYGWSQLYGQPVVVAVSGFDNQSDVLYLDSWERTAPDLLQAELSRSSKITSVERRKLADVFNEHKLALSGFADSAHSKQIGRLLEADFIISGTINKFASVYRIDLDITRVKTGEVISEKAEAGDADHLPEMISLLANNIKYHLTGETAYLEKIGVEKYPTTWFLLASIGFGATSAIFHSQYIDHYDRYHQTDNPAEMDTYYDEATTARVVRNVALGLSAVALAGTIFSFMKNNQLKDIKAYEKDKPRVLPSIYFNKRESVRFALQIHF